MENIQWQSIHCTDLNCIYGAFIVTLSDTLKFCNASDHHLDKPSVDINKMGLAKQLSKCGGDASASRGVFLDTGKPLEEE